jgi:hypothetical protein
MKRFRKIKMLSRFTLLVCLYAGCVTSWAGSDEYERKIQKMDELISHGLPVGYFEWMPTDLGHKMDELISHGLPVGYFEWMPTDLGHKFCSLRFDLSEIVHASKSSFCSPSRINSSAGLLIMQRARLADYIVDQGWKLADERPDDDHGCKCCNQKVERMFPGADLHETLKYLFLENRGYLFKPGMKKGSQRWRLKNPKRYLEICNEMLGNTDRETRPTLELIGEIKWSLKPQNLVLWEPPAWVANAEDEAEDGILL